MNRAYSTFEVKNLDEDARVIEGIATTPTPDRVGDVVEPKGAEFKLPIPLLWQHDSRQPIGHVTRAKVTEDGIAITAKFARVAEAGNLKNRLDEAWQSVKSGLVRGLSIGFRPTEEPEPLNPKDPWGGVRFMAWEWLELSAVTIPANMDASIQSIKSLDEASLSAALRAKTADPASSRQAPGGSGKTAVVKLRSKEMPTIKETISAYEAKRAANVAAMSSLMDKASEKGESLDEEKQKEFDALQGEVEQIDGHIARLKVTERLNLEKATPIDPNAGTDPDHAARARSPYGAGVRVESKLEPGVKFARMAMAMARSKAMGMGVSPEQVYRSEKRWMDTAPEVALAIKTAVNAGDSTTAGWASEWAYAQNIASEFIEFLRPMTIIGRVSGWRNVPFNVRVGGQSGGSTGYWVGQGKPIPMSKLTSTSVSLGIAKVAGVVAIDKELARLSSPSAELMVRNDLARECQETLDLSLIDPNQGGQTNIQPASLLYGVTPVTPSGTNYAAFCTDVKSLFSTMITANLPMQQCVLIMSETTALALSLMVTSLGNPQFPGLSISGGNVLGLPVIVSNLATISGSPQFSNMIVAVNPGEVFLADDGAANLEASDQVSLQMDDAPTNQSTATATATTMVSMFQTESIAIKAVRYINWAKRRSQCAAFIQAAAYA